MSEAIRDAVKAPEKKKGNQFSQVQKCNFYQPDRSPVEKILYLQRTIGNQSIQRLMKSEALQAKLTISAPGDRYEREADRVAEQVMRMPEPAVQLEASCPFAKGSSCKEKEEILQTKEMGGKTTQNSPAVESRINSLRGGGQPLPESVSAFFEPRFGHDFSQVRVHTDVKAAESTRAVNALAYTVGNDIVFAHGQYAPKAAKSKRLLAHELTHVVQQTDSFQEALPSVKNKIPQSGLGRSAGIARWRIMRVATDPVVPVRAQITLGAGVGRSRPNRSDDVRSIQDRLLELRYLSAIDHTTEYPATTGTTPVPETSLAATIVAIKLFQTNVMGIAAPDGRVDAGGNTLKNLNRAIPRPTAAELTAVTTARTGIAETVTRGVTITSATGNVPPVTVTAGTANINADVVAVQTRLVQLGHLAAGHGEAPASGVANVPVASLPLTIAAIRQFQTREVNYWLGRGVIAGTVTAGTVSPGDATLQLLNNITNYREVFPTGEDIRFRDFPRSPYTEHTGGTSFTGTASPSALSAADYATIGLTPDQTAALQYVSSHEGNFDALNTYDRARVSFGFIQFAGGRGLPPFMALLKSRNPTAFASMFQTYGVDVEFNVVGGRIMNPTIVVLDPTAGTVLRGTAAEAAIRDSARLSAIFIRAGRSADVQRAQVEAATRDYILPALCSSASYTADIIEVLDAPGGTITATHVGEAARTFRATPAYTTLVTAGRVVERTSVTSATLQTLLSSQQGLATLMDRSIQEGLGGGTARLAGAMLWVADNRGLTNITGVAALEAAVLQQVVNDFTADIDIAAMLGRTVTALRTLKIAAAAATVAVVIARMEANTARTEVDNAVMALPRKSFGASRTRLETNIPTERTQLNFAPPPATIAALRTLINGIITRLNGLTPNSTNATAMRARIRNILTSGLTPP